jgi:hypothetical protein
MYPRAPKPTYPLHRKSTVRPGSEVRSPHLQTPINSAGSFLLATARLLIAVAVLLATVTPAFAQLPPGWSDQDIGFPSIGGSASEANGNWNVSGGGSDIWNSADNFHYAFEGSTDNAVAIARVVSMDNTDPWAKAGVMFRDDSAPESMFAMVVATPGNGVNFQWRNSTGGQCGYSQVGRIFAPVWVKLVRFGNVFTGYYSPDGSGWTTIGPSETIAMNSTPLVGLAVTAHNDGLLCTATFDNVTISNAPPPPPAVFGVYRELWPYLDPTPGNTLDALTNTAWNPNWPDFPDPSFTQIFTDFETPANIGMNLYGQRVRAYVVPPTNGNYTFWISSDDTSQLFLSTDEDPTHKQSIAGVPGWTNTRQWSNYPQQQSPAITLEGSRRYYIEAIMQQGFGGDNLAVRWQLPDGSFEEPLTAIGPSGTRLVPFDGVLSSPGIYQQTTNLTVLEGLNAFLSVLVTNGAPVTYQWYLGANPISGATKPSLVVSNVNKTINNGQVYTCKVTDSLGTVPSSPITLTVISDTTPPTITRVLNIGTNLVQITFSETIEAASATQTSNYAFTNGLPVTLAALGGNNNVVTLTTAPMVYGSNYTIVVNRVRDRASVPNTIATNTLAKFTALPYALQDIGSPPIPTTITVVSNGINITASGSDVGGYSDQCGFSYQLRTGDFDVATRIAGINPSDVWAKAGLMAREGLDNGSRFAAALATPAMNGSFFEWRDPASNLSSTSGNFPANYPYTWVRLKRAGNTFTGFASYDGQSWTQLGAATISMPAQIYFGFVVSSHNPGQVTTAQFRDTRDVTNAVVGVVTNPNEPLGPSSRKTPIAITEIMYKPAPRADTNNLEFIELYNSNPWFHDISGYKLVADNLSYTVPQGTVIQGGAFFVIAASPSSIANVYGIANVLGPYTGSLGKSDTLQLLDEVGAVLLTIPYSSKPPWPVAADGVGHSLVLANPTYGEGDSHAWTISDMVGGSPGQMDGFRPSPLRNVVINEFLAHTDPPLYDYIELYNHANTPVDISGCILTDDPTTNKFIVPPGTSIPARGFVYYSETNMNFKLNAEGETIYFKNPDQSRVIDAVHFGGEENGVATGRWPDGANEFYRLSALTPGRANAGIRQSDIVINELMYDPISGNDDDQYIELFNRSAKTINLGGWELDDAVSFAFPSNVVMNPGTYLVVAGNAAHLRTNYANLNLNNCLGDFSGKLSHNGEHLALTMPDTTFSTNLQGVITTNLIHITVNDLTYGTGGHWGQWAAGGGSSLELIDPNSNNRLAPNWADSDETQKSSWVNIETTGVLDNGLNYDPSIDYAQIGLLDVGECLVDNIEVRSGTVGANLVLNPDFESGLGSWSMQGDHSRSSQENTGYLSSRSLHIRCSDRMWTGDNSCQMAQAGNTLDVGQTATLRYKARWLRGWPEVLLRLNGNWLEATGRMPVPANLGTPGAPNSRLISDAGPATYSVTHSPSIPAANQAVVVSARVHDFDGVQNLTLNYRIDPSTTYAQVAMRDDGIGGDSIAGDGIFSATIPGQNVNTIVAFYISATDTKSASTRFPVLVNDNAPVRECVVMFGDGNPSGSFGVYHLWITQVNANRWTQLSDLSNESHDCTIVNGSRVIYNAQARFAGSPYHQGFDTPNGNLCHYKWIFPDDDKFLGVTSFNKLHQPGNGAGDDGSIQREQLANTLLRTLGVPWLNRRYVAVYVNGNRRGTLMEDTQTPDNDVVKEHFPNDENGWLYKMQPWFEFAPDPTGIYIPFNNCSWCTIMPYTTTGGAKKVARYRYNFLVRRTPVSCNDFTNVFSIVDAASSFGTPNYVANMENVADMENWMRVFAANHAAGNWDSYGCQNAQNLYGYVGAQGTKYSLLMFDFNIVFGNSGSWGPGQNLFSVNGQDPNTQNIFNDFTFRRMYWRALQELVNGPLDTANSGPLLDAKYNAFVANGLNVENPNSGIKGWLTQAKNSIAAQIARENAGSFTVNTSVTINNGVGYITGSAPVNVKTIWVNGAEYPLTWTSVAGFSIAVPLRPGNNSLSVVGVDIHGQVITGTSNNVAAFYNGTATSPVGQVVINEIMYQPVQPGAEYVELYNASATATFDLSNWQFRGLSYTFPPGSTIGPNSFLVLAANGPAFAAAYGATIPVFDTFTGTLQNDGETLSLVQPGTNTASDVIISRVRYGSTLPWPAGAAGAGSSLQLIDPRQDNWRAGNWAGNFPPAFYTPGAANSVLTTLPAFPSLWINELQADNLTGITNRFGQHTPWLELYNPSTNTISLTGLYLANSYTNLTLWAFPAGASINPREFKVIFADGQSALSTLTELHTSFVLPSGAGSLAVSRLYNAKPQVLDYVGYTNLSSNHSYGSFPDAQSFTRQDFFYATPGGTNNGTSASLTIAINEWMAANTNTIADPVNGKYEDWFELYNYGTNTADLTGFFLTDTVTNQFKFQIPSGYTVPPHSFLLVWADGKTTNGTPDLHVDFKLSKAGSDIGLYGADGRPVDVVSFGAQAEDVSMGRYPDGSANIYTMIHPTPRISNVLNNTPPVITPIGNQYVYLGQAMNVSVKATDSDVPTQTLTYTLDLGAPNNASINPATGLLSWAPTSDQVSNTYPFTVRVTDNGVPPASSTQAFTATALNPPSLGVVGLNGNTLTLGWQSVPGRVYRVEYKDFVSASAWTALGTDQPGTGGVLTLTVNVIATPQRYYRILIVQ